MAVEANLSIELHNLDLYLGKSLPSHIPLVEENIMESVEANLSIELHNLDLYLR